MKVKAKAQGEQLTKLTITGSSFELRSFALTILDAVELGRGEVQLADAVIRIKCEA